MDKRKNINAVNLDVAGSINLLEVVIGLDEIKVAYVNRMLRPSIAKFTHQND